MAHHMSAQHLTEPSKIGTYFTRTTKGGNWQLGQWLPSGFVLVAQNLSNRELAERIARLLNAERGK